MGSVTGRRADRPPIVSPTRPTIKGPISLSVSKGTSYKISVTLPTGVTAKVYVKDYGSLGTNVTVDGVSKSGTLKGKYVVFEPVSPGPHTFEKAIGQ